MIIKNFLCVIQKSSMVGMDNMLTCSLNTIKYESRVWKMTVVFDHSWE